MIFDKDVENLQNHNFSFMNELDFFSEPSYAQFQSSSNLEEETPQHQQAPVSNANNKEEFNLSEDPYNQNYFNQNNTQEEQPLLFLNKNPSNYFNCNFDYCQAEQLYHQGATEQQQQSTCTQSGIESVEYQQQNEKIEQNFKVCEDQVQQQEQQEDSTDGDDCEQGCEQESEDLQLKEQQNSYCILSNQSEEISHSQLNSMENYNYQQYDLNYAEQKLIEDEVEEDEEEESSESYIPYQEEQQNNRRRSQRKRICSKRYTKYTQLYEQSSSEYTCQEKKSKKQVSQQEKIQQKKIRKREVTMNYKNKRSSEETKNLPTTIGKILLKCLKKKLPQVAALQKMRIISNKEHFQQLFSINKIVQEHAIQFLTSGPMIAYLASSTRLKQKRLVIKYIDIIVEGAIDPANFKCFKQNSGFCM